MRGAVPANHCLCMVLYKANGLITHATSEKPGDFLNGVIDLVGRHDSLQPRRHRSTDPASATRRWRGTVPSAVAAKCKQRPELLATCVGEAIGSPRGRT